MPRFFSFFARFHRLAETVPTSPKPEPRAKKQPARGENSALRSTPQMLTKRINWQVGGVELVDYQPFLDYFRKTHDKRKKERMAKAKKHAVKRRGAVRKVQTKPPPTRHDSVTIAIKV